MKLYHVDVYLRPGHYLSLTEDQRLDRIPEHVYTAEIFDHYERAVEAATIESTREYCAKVVVLEVRYIRNRKIPDEEFDEIVGVHAAA